MYYAALALSYIAIVVLGAALSSLFGGAVGVATVGLLVMLVSLIVIAIHRPK